MFSNIIRNKIFVNASWLIVGKVIQLAINFLVGILTARFLGPSNYGLIGYASAYSAFFFSICTLGINSVLVKELIDNPNCEGKVLGTTLVLRVISCVCSWLTIVGISFYLDSNEPITKIVVLLYNVNLVFQVFDTFNYWFQAKLQSKKTAIATLLAYTLTAIYRGILLWLEKPVEYFALAVTVDHICFAIAIYYFYKKNRGEVLSFSWRYGKSLVSKSYHFILPSLMVAVYGQSDKIMLKNLYNQAEVGYYAIATSLCMVWCFVLSAIIDSFTPIIMQAYNEDTEKFNRVNRMLYCIIFYVSTGVSIFFTLFADWGITLLFGDAYRSAIRPFCIITWYTAFSYLGVARNPWVVCNNKQKYLKYIYFIAAITNIVLNFYLIPSMGAVGAAIASLITQIVTVMIAPLFIEGFKENTMLMLEAIMFKGLKGVH